MKKSKHATVKTGGYEVPLIGIPKEATTDVCDACGHWFNFSDLKFTDGQLECPKCRKASLEN